MTNLCILGKLVCSNVIDREDQFDVILLGLLDKAGHLFRACGVKQGVADLNKE